MLRYLISLPITAHPICDKHFTHQRTRCLDVLFQSYAQLSLLRPSIAQTINRSTGISTCYPSTTPFGLALGPDSPRADQLYPGNLGYSAVGILTPLSLLIPAFSLPVTPLSLSAQLLCSQECSPTDALRHPRVSVLRFSPGHFRRRTSRLVSCYALFKRMAASKPTS